MRRSKRSSRLMAASSASSRRATWSFWTRSVVRVKRTFQPFSTRARPIAEARWLLPPPRGTEEEQVRARGEPGIASRDRHDLSLGDHRDGVEVEAVERLAGRQARLGEVALDPAPVAFGELVLGNGGQEAGGGPALLVGLLGELGPDRLDGRQTQFVQHHAEAGGIDGGGRLHAAPPTVVEPRRLS